MCVSLADAPIPRIEAPTLTVNPFATACEAEAPNDELLPTVVACVVPVSSDTVCVPDEEESVFTQAPVGVDTLKGKHPASVIQPLQLVHTRSEEAVAGVVIYCPGPQVVKSAQIRKLFEEGCDTVYWLEVQMGDFWVL